MVSAVLMYGQAPRKRSGPGACFMGYYSTNRSHFAMEVWRGASDSGVRPLMGTWVLSWPAPSFDGGSSLAGAVVPPTHPPTFLETGGLPLYPRRGLRPLHPAWGTVASAVIPPGPLSNVFPNRGTPPVPLTGDCAPRTLLGAGMGGGLMARAPLSRPLRPGTFSRTGGQ